METKYVGKEVSHKVPIIMQATLEIKLAFNVQLNTVITQLKSLEIS